MACAHLYRYITSYHIIYIYIYIYVIKIIQGGQLGLDGNHFSVGGEIKNLRRVVHGKRSLESEL